MATRVTLTSLPDTAISHTAIPHTAISHTAVPNRTVAVVKTPLSGDRADRAAEAAWLRAAAGRGTVELVESEAPGLVTTWVPGNTLRTSDQPPAAMAAVLAELARRLVTLHEAGLVHAKVTLDHVIVGPDGPVLCSPNGTPADPALDAAGLGRCVSGLIDRWDERDVPIPRRADWLGLAQRLGDEHDPLPLHRAIAALDRLTSTVEPAPEPGATPDRSPRRLGVGLVAAAIVASLGGLMLTSRPDGVSLPAGVDPATTPAEGRPVVEVEGQRYRVGRPGDVALAVTDGCVDQPIVVLLDVADATVWRFDRSGFDSEHLEAAGTAIATVPGASELTLEPAPEIAKARCPTVWAGGPAGRTLVIDAG